MVDVIGKVFEAKAKKIGRSPMKSNRASMLGHFVPVLGGCVRRGVYERTRWEDKELHDVRLQMVFDEGHHQEERVLKDLADAGVAVIEQQSAGEWEKYNITYHLDGMVQDGDQWIPIEIKSMAPTVFQGIHSLADFQKRPWTRSYLCQIMIYMLGKNIDRALFVLKDKSSGQLKQIEVSLDYELAEACIQTAEQINAHVSAGTLPDRITDREKCRECPFKMICLPEVSWGQELKIADDPEFEARLNAYKERQDMAKEVDAEYEIIRSRAVATAAGGPLNLIVGNWRLAGKPDAKGAFRLKITSIDEV